MIVAGIFSDADFSAGTHERRKTSRLENATTRAYVSERRLDANRPNGRLSRGPQTRAGKETVSRNALRHGLAVSVLKDAKMATEVASLAQIFAGNDAIAVVSAHAGILAEALFDLERIQMAKVQLMNSCAGSSSVSEVSGRATPGCANEQSTEAVAHELELGPHIAGVGLIEILPHLWRLNRYERRARSRRNRAMRDLVRSKSSSVAGR